jgi:copper chaperone
MSETVLRIEGMTCGHCKMAVEKALKVLPGVTDVRVDLEAKNAVVSGSAESRAMEEAVVRAGFKVVG